MCGQRDLDWITIRGLLANSLETAALTAEGFKDVGKGPGSRTAQYIEFLTIPDQKQAVIDDVERIRNHPLVPASIPVYGYVYDVKTGKLIEIEEATKIGAAR
jgi:carbonic anhydrase